MAGVFYPGKLYPDETLAGCIDVFYGVWPEPDETIKAIEEECSRAESGMSWFRAETMGQGANQKHRTNYNFGVTMTAEAGNPLAQNVHNQMYMLLLAALGPYQEKHGIDDMELWHEPYNILRYRTGQEYKAHYDGSTASGRTVSAIIYLNNEFEGGEVEFVNYGVKIKPEPGMLLLFPSNYAYRHIAHPVTDGTKYALVTWLADRKI